MSEGFEDSLASAWSVLSDPQSNAADFGRAVLHVTRSDVTPEDVPQTLPPAALHRVAELLFMWEGEIEGALWIGESAQAACKILAFVGGSSLTVLRPLLRDPGYNLEYVLTAMVHCSGTEDVCSVLLTHRDSSVREDAAEALRSFGGAGVKVSVAVPALLSALRDPEASVRQAACQTLIRYLPLADERDAVKFGGFRVTDLLLPFLEATSSDEAVRSQIHCLRHLPHLGCVEVSLCKLASHRDPRTRRAVAELLGALPPNLAGNPTSAALAWLRKDRERSVADAAERSVAALQGEP